MMRKNLIYGALILCMGLLLGSCSKNDDPKTSELAGTWKLKEKGLHAMGQAVEGQETHMQLTKRQATERFTRLVSAKN